MFVMIFVMRICNASLSCISPRNGANVFLYAQFSFHGQAPTQCTHLHEACAHKPPSCTCIYAHNPPQNPPHPPIAKYYTKAFLDVLCVRVFITFRLTYRAHLKGICAHSCETILANQGLLPSMAYSTTKQAFRERRYAFSFFARSTSTICL